MSRLRQLLSVSAMIISPVFTGASVVHAQPESTGMTLEAALATAVRSHPEIVRLRAQVDGASARADAIGTTLNPELGAQASVGVGASPPLDFWDPTASANVGIVFGWTVTDFGRTRANERAARQFVQADVESIKAVERDIGLGVEESFFQALAMQELVKVAVVNYEAEKRHREEAERFVAAGQRAAIEVARAKTQEARAKTELVRAEAAARQAHVFLARAMGVREVPSSVVASWPAPGLEGDPVAVVGAGVDGALGERVEIKAARARVEAARSAVDASELGTAPTLRVSAGAGFGSRDFEEWGPDWVAGVSLNWPFLDGGRTAALTEAARADVRASEAVVDELAYFVAAEVQSQEVALISAGAEVDAARAAREAAEVELRLAEARWREGLGSGIELADAQARLTATDADRTRAELTRALAGVRLKRALGR